MSGNAIFSSSVVSSGLAAYPTIYYDRVAVKTLYHHLALYPACDLRPMPNMSGTAMQIFSTNAMTANTTAATEGAPSTGQSLTQVVATLNLANYVDYITYSNVAVLTMINNIVEDGTKQLSYRGAFSVDTVIANQLDTIANGNTASRIDIHEASFMSAAIARRAASSLGAVDVLPKANGNYYGVLPALVGFDLINDSATGGFLDLEKFGLMGKGDATLNAGFEKLNFIGSVGGVDWYKSNALPTESNWESSSSIGYHAYVIGEDGIIASTLGRTELGQRNFAVKTGKFDQPTAVDPGNQIAAASSYNFFFGCIGRPGSVAGFRRIRCQASLTS